MIAQLPIIVKLVLNYCTVYMLVNQSLRYMTTLRRTKFRHYSKSRYISIYNVRHHTSHSQYRVEIDPY